MIRILFYYTLLSAVVLLAFRVGRRDEQTAALVCVAGTLLTLATAHSLPTRFEEFNPAAFAIDLMVMVAFITIALRSERFWPMWVAGVQLTAVSVHLLRLLDNDMISFVFGAALAAWSYPVLLLIGIGSLRTRIVERWREQAIASEAGMT